MEKIKELYLRYKLIVWPFCVGLSSLAILVLVVIPQLFAYLNIQNEITELEKRTSTLEVKAQNLQQVDDAANRENLQIALTILPREADVPQSMAVLQSVIGESELLLKNAAYVPSRISEGGKSNFLFDVEIVGSVESVKDFLANLQESPRVFQVGQISAQFQRDGLMDVTLPIAVFYDPTMNVGNLSPDKPIPQLSDKEKALLAKLTKLIPKAVSLSQTDTSSVPLGKNDPFE
ncbi:MAG: hypothetical protein Q7S44_01520 [bacterium]|nr:hypothetical protein [bacterium]